MGASFDSALLCNYYVINPESLADDKTEANCNSLVAQLKLKLPPKDEFTGDPTDWDEFYHDLLTASHGDAVPVIQRETFVQIYIKAFRSFAATSMKQRG